MNLDEGYRFLNFVANKEDLGKTMQVREYNTNLESASLDYWNVEYQKLRAYARENGMLEFQIVEIGEPLRPFLDYHNALTIPATGKMPTPPLFASARSLRGLVDGLPREILIISAQKMNKRLTNALEDNLYYKPACLLFADFIHIYPKTMTEIVMTYLRKPRKPYYAFQQNTTTDLPEYVATDEIRADMLLTVSGTGPADGDTMAVEVVEVGKGGNTVVLGSWTADNANYTISDATWALASNINKRAKSHGYEAEVVSAIGGTILVKAPVGYGAFPSSGVTGPFTTTESSTGVTLILTETTTWGALTIGVAGSTQLEFDEIYHMEIYKRILANMGTNLSDEKLVAYQQAFQVASV